MVVYILELVENKFYVGKTERNVYERLREHCFSGNGSLWCKKYTPLKLFETVDIDDRHFTESSLENDITLVMMRLYGWKNVRGGSWCSIEYEKPPCELLLRDIIIHGIIYHPDGSKTIGKITTQQDGDILMTK